ncbi:MAG: cellulase family glycosylhydrolase [Chthoniobacterales bacterium]|nr:cellulase family glycosylhydrolase [Chthoniobacterales bacterium]
MEEPAAEAITPQTEATASLTSKVGCTPTCVLWHLTLLALGVKSIILIADPNPQFFLGDSASYLNSALTGWIPPDRSYLYGYVIRWLCVGSGSLFSLLVVQTLASSLSAGILGWSLRRFLQIPGAVAIVVTIAYALEPLQLMYDRFVMAESFSLCAAMVFISCLLVFIDTGKRRFLVFASFAGIVSVAFRISFLPPVTALSFAAPILRFFWTDSERRLRHARVKALLISMAVITLSYFAFHTSYKLLTGKVSGAPPAYQYADGLSLLSSWCPILQLTDLPATGVSDHIFDGTYPRTFENRRGQRWMVGGIVEALHRAYPDSLQANVVAKRIAMQILRRDPMDVAGLAFHTYCRGWRRDVIKGCISEDTGNRVIPPELVQIAERRFHIAAADMPTRRTLTKSYFGRAIAWYRVLLLTPFLLMVGAAFAHGNKRMFIIFMSIYSLTVLLTAMGLAVDNSIRYLHPLSWALFAFAAYCLSLLAPKIRSRFSRATPALGLALLAGCFFGMSHSTMAAVGSKGLYVTDGVLMRKGKPYLGIGANYNSLFGQLLKDKDNNSSLAKLAELAKAGIPFVRFRACGFGPENQQLYLQDRAEYFRRMDQVVRAAEQNNIGLIPSLFWRLATVSETLGESRDQLGNPNSKSNQFIRQYTKEIVGRYNDSPAIWGWEFGNEANLGVDLHKGGRRSGILGGANSELSSAQLRVPFTTFAQTVRSIDPSRIIDTGTTRSRPAAWHMARGQNGSDNAEQSFSALLTLTPDPIDVISVHVYEKAKGTYPGANSIAGILSDLNRSAAAARKPLFLGEFPTREPAQAQEFIQAIEAARVPLSAFWVFDLPAQEATMNVSFTNQRAFVFDMIAKANQALQSR